jgi:hypothetical protein
MSDQLPSVTYHDKVDRLQVSLAKFPQVDMPLTHRFTPGLYVREIFMPKGSLVISKIHKTEHPYAILKGHAAVLTEDGAVQQIKAPFIGITKAGTRRVLFVHEDCVWATFHTTNLTDLAAIEEQIIEKRDVSKCEPVEIDADVLKQLQEP